MANRIFLDVDGDWNNVNNWSGAAVPIDGDDVFIGEGTKDLLTNLNQSSIQLDSLRIGSGYTGTIGATGDKLRIDATEFFFDSGGDACWITGVLPDVLVAGGLSGANMLQIGGDINDLKVVGGALGTITLAASTILDNLLVTKAPSVKVIIPSTVTSLDDFDIADGDVTCGADIAGEVQMLGGTFTMTDDKPGATVNTIELLAGVVNYNSAGALAVLNVFEGLFSLEDNVAASVELTAPTIHEGGVMNLRNALNNVSLPAGIIYHGGEIIWPRGLTLSAA